MKVSHCVFCSIYNATQIKCFVSRPIEVYEVHGRGGLILIIDIAIRAKKSKNLLLVCRAKTA